MQLLQWQSKGTENWTKCSFFGKHHLDDREELFLERKRSNDDLCFLNQTKNYSQLSKTMSENFTPTFVYQRKRLRKNPASNFTVHSSAETKPSDGSHSAISSEAPSLAAQENGTTINVDRALNICSANDNCSSSKSNLELSLSSTKIDTDDSGECSSSGALNADKFPEEYSARDICISILKSQGLLDRIWTKHDRASSEISGASNRNYCSKPCKICERIGSTLKMLICDSCDDAFHVSCCGPNMKMLPVGEWLCSSCSKKKHKIVKDKFAGNSMSEGELGSLEIMFRDTEPYMSNVRIGDEFQSDVPDWRGPIHEECDHIADLLETDPSNNNFNMQERDSTKSLKLSSIWNWLQCREVIEGIGEGVDGTICGKWRRAPLFEVQTDNWECFRCILWDPAYADCAVPQEIETEEVMKQLKYIEMLGPQLAAKRRKLDSSKKNGSSSL